MRLVVPIAFKQSTRTVLSKFVTSSSNYLFASRKL